MIKNSIALKSLIKRYNYSIDMLEEALYAAMPENSLTPHFADLPDEPIHIISYGKAAHAMAQAASKHLAIAGGLIVSPKGKRLPPVPNMKIHYASHPLPDECSAIAARAIIKYLEQIPSFGYVLFLISGGGSSLISLPPKGITSSDLASATHLLLNSGAKISAINCIRRHISEVAGGRLASHVKCKSCALIISDVQGNHIQDISSGCTTHDNTTYSDALKHIRNLHLESYMPKSIMMRLHDGANGIIQDGPKKTRTKNHIISDSFTCAKSVAKKARSYGLRVHLIQIYDNVQKESKRIVNNTKHAKNSCIVFYGEPTIKVKGKGYGGRNQQLVLHLLSQYAKKNMHCIVCSVGTDGIDGNTKYAGAIVDTAIKYDMQEIAQFLKNNDSSSFFAKYGGRILTGQTGTNLADVGFIIVCKDG